MIRQRRFLLIGLAVRGRANAPHPDRNIAMAKNWFLKLEGFSGGSRKDQAHQGWFDLLGWSFGGQSSTVNPGGGKGGPPPKPSQLSVTLRQSPSSVDLMRAMVNATSISKATIHGVDDKHVFEMNFENLYVASYQTGGTDSDRNPIEYVEFDIGKEEEKKK